MSSINQLLTSVKLTGSDKKQIADVTAQYQAIGDIQLQTAAVTIGNPGPPLHLAVDAAILALENEPTRENAERLHDAIVRREQANLSAGTIAHHLHGAFMRTSAKLKPLALRIIDEAEAAAKETHKTQREAMVAGGVDKAVLATHDAKLSETLANLEGERKSAEAHALDFIQRHGIGI